MAKVVKGLFGGGDDGAAKKEAAKSRQLQQVANDRQLAELNRKDTAVAASRRAPRGRRLFEDGPTSSDAVLN
jgi:hypothetical protein